MPKPAKEITRVGKWTAGILFIAATITALILLVGYWPDRLPENETDSGYYRNDLFHVCLLDKTCSCSMAVSDSTADNAAVAVQGEQKFCENSIHLNTVLMILVALAGFLGCLIHIASSFTNFVGSNKFKRSWVLWYYVKPFTAAALAMVMYFVFRAGLLSFNDPSSINLYGLVTLAALTGLFTDKATIKLEEFFEVVFKPKDERPDKMEEEPEFTAITPAEIEKNIENIITLSGKNLDGHDLTITINDEEVSDVTFEPTVITIRYTIPASQDTAAEFKVVVNNAEDTELYTATLKLKPVQQGGEPGGGQQGGGQGGGQQEGGQQGGGE
jgi:hypothetical protein